LFYNWKTYSINRRAHVAGSWLTAVRRAIGSRQEGSGVALEAEAGRGKLDRSS
jgi:hypothetical protein